MVYAIKIVVAYSLLAYKIVFFKLFTTYFLTHIFQNISLKCDPKLEHTPILSAKFEIHMGDLFVGLEQVRTIVVLLLQKCDCDNGHSYVMTLPLTSKLF